MIKIVPIEEHDSWLALDMVWGCANDCAYCFLRDSSLTGSTPKLKLAPDTYIREQIAAALRHCPEDVPVSIGNTTDLFLTAESRGILYKIARLVAELDPQRLIIMITKVEITDRIAKETADAAGGNGLVFLSQSFAKDYDHSVERGHVSSPEDTYRSFQTIAKTDGLKAAHFWRPFLSRWNPREQLFPRLQNLRDSGCPCSVVIGLKGNPQLVASYSAELRSWAEPELRQKRLPSEEWVSMDHLTKLIALAKELDYPIFRHTSCAIAFLQSRPDINGTSASDKRHAYCENTTCPGSQRAVCAQDPLWLASEEQLNHLLQRYAGNAKILDNGTILIPDELDEFSYNHLIHVLHRRPYIKGVRPSLVWRNTANGAGGKYGTI